MNRRRSSRRSIWGTLVSLLALLILLTALIVDTVALGPFGQPAVQAAPIEGRKIPFTDVNPYGVNVFLHKEVEDWKKDKTLQMVKEAGFGYVKQQFPWSELEFRKGYFYDDKWGKSSWEKFDQIVDIAEKYDLQIIARLDRAPEWARPQGSNAGAPATDVQDYADFVAAFVEHYKGRVNYIQIWNEPNLHDEWLEGTPVDAAKYVEMLKAAYKSAKAVDPSIVVLSAPMAMTLENDPGRRNLNELIYVEEMYQAGAKDYFDIMSANGYGLEYPPDAPADPNVLNFRRVSLLHDIMVKYGDDAKPIWLNEYGWNASPADMPEEKLIWRRVTEEQQAKWTVQGIEQARKEWPWLGVVSIWYFRQVGDIAPDQSEYYFAMVDPEFMARPVYDAIKESAIRLQTAGPGLYQETNPAVVKTGGWSEGMSDLAFGKTYARASSPGSKISFHFQGTELSILVRKGPDGGMLYVSVDGETGTLGGLPKDEDGRAYVDLYSPEESWQQEVAIVRGLGEQFPSSSHFVELELASKSNPESSGTVAVVDAFGVAEHRSYTLFVASAGGILVAIVVVAAVWLRSLMRT